MNYKNLLILGAGQYGTVAKEIAKSMGCFEKIGFLDDRYGTEHPDYCEEPIGRLDEYEKFSDEYGNAIVAIGNPELRRRLIEKLKEASYRIVSLVSPMAYISPSAQLEEGCIVEPCAVVQANTIIGTGTIVSSGAVVNHNCMVSAYCHIDCGAIIESNVLVEAGCKINSGNVVRRQKSKS